VIAFANKLHLH